MAQGASGTPGHFNRCMGSGKYLVLMFLCRFAFWRQTKLPTAYNWRLLCGCLRLCCYALSSRLRFSMQITPLHKSSNLLSVVCGNVVTENVQFRLSLLRKSHR